jgi:hypothetical protein
MVHFTYYSAYCRLLFFNSVYCSRVYRQEGAAWMSLFFDRFYWLDRFYALTTVYCTHTCISIEYNQCCAVVLSLCCLSGSGSDFSLWCRSRSISRSWSYLINCFDFSSQQCQFTLFFLSHQCQRCQNVQNFWQHMEIFWKKFSLSLHLVEMDSDLDPDPAPGLDR